MWYTAICAIIIILKLVELAAAEEYCQCRVTIERSAVPGVGVG